MMCETAWRSRSSTLCPSVKGRRSLAALRRRSMRPSEVGRSASSRPSREESPSPSMRPTSMAPTTLSRRGPTTTPMRPNALNHARSGSALTQNQVQRMQRSRSRRPGTMATPRATQCARLGRSMPIYRCPSAFPSWQRRVLSCGSMHSMPSTIGIRHNLSIRTLVRLYRMQLLDSPSLRE